MGGRRASQWLLFPLPAHVGDELLIRLFLLGVPVDLD